MRLPPARLAAIAAIAALLPAAPCLAVGCDELRAEVEAKIRAAGVSQFSVTVAAAAASAPGQVVGSCDNGSRKLLYQRPGSRPTDTAAPAPSTGPRPATKSEPILTECKDGTVSLHTDCRR